MAGVDPRCPGSWCSPQTSVVPLWRLRGGLGLSGSRGAAVETRGAAPVQQPVLGGGSCLCEAPGGPGIGVWLRGRWLRRVTAWCGPCDVGTPVGACQSYQRAWNLGVGCSRAPPNPVCSNQLSPRGLWTWGSASQRAPGRVGTRGLVRTPGEPGSRTPFGSPRPQERPPQLTPPRASHQTPSNVEGRVTTAAPTPWVKWRGGHGGTPHVSRADAVALRGSVSSPELQVPLAPA